MTGVSRAQEFDELKGFNKNEIRPYYYIPITSAVTAPSPKSHIFPLVMDLIPLAVLGGVGGYCATVPYGDWYNPTKRDCLGSFYLVGWGLMSLGAIPSSIYVENKWYGTLGLTVGKAVLFLGLSIVGISRDINKQNGDGGVENYDGGSALLKEGIIPALVGTFIIYGYEMIDHQLKVRKYNIELEQKAPKNQTVITPLIWKDRVGLALQMSF